MRNVIAACTLSFFAMSASAADDAGSAQWQGIYGGVSAGSMRSTSSFTNMTSSTVWETPGVKNENKNTDNVWGGQLGYQFVRDNLLLGVELSGSSGTETSRMQSMLYSWHYNQMEVGPFALLGGRIGYVQDNWLVYGKAGFAMGKVKYHSDDFPAYTNYNIYDQSAWQNGWQLGAGVEYAITRNIRVALDYTHIDLGSKTETKDWHTLAGVYGGRETFRLDAKADVTALRLNYAF